jgi:2-phospho-L-lactate guanylyltransferase
MAVHAIIPVKNLDESKKRLSPVFTPQERATLTLAMMEAVLKALNSSVVNKITVISNDSKIHQVACRLSASFIWSSREGLNPAVEEAAKFCIQNHSDSMLVLAADIPLVLPTDINILVELGSEKKTVVLSPSCNGGTNAMLRNPPNLLRSRFGSDSFVKHAKDAFKMGARVRIYHSLGTSLDVDSVDDLKRLLEIENSNGNVRFLKQSGLLDQTKNSFSRS